MHDQIEAIVGPRYLLTGKEMARWSTDWTGTSTWTPSAVVRPANTSQVSSLLKWANIHHKPVVPVGGNTGLAGGTKADEALMISLDRMADLSINARARTASVGAGVVLANLHASASEQKLRFPMTFGARGSAMLGGLLSTNAGGSNVLRYGNMRDLCIGLEVVLASGEILDVASALHKDNTGLDLKSLFIGAEGTLGIITKAVLKLVAEPHAHATAFLATKSLNDALDILYHLQSESAGCVEAFEFMSATHMDTLAKRSPSTATPLATVYPVNLLVELASTSPADAKLNASGKPALVAKLETVLAKNLEDNLVLDAVIAQSEAQRLAFWERRELAAEISLSRKPHVNNDIAVPLERVQDFFELATAALTKVNPGFETISQSHLGDGNIHYVVYPTHDDPDLKAQIVETVEHTVAELGGSFSAEHGIGVTKKATLLRRKDPVALATMRGIKRTLDPNRIMNPGKVYDA